MEYPELVQSAFDIWNTLVSVDGFGLFVGYLVVAGAVVGFLISLIVVILVDVFDIVHASCPLIKRFINDRKAKKSGKLTNEQRLELLEEKIDSLADIVISTSEEVK